MKTELKIHKGEYVYKYPVELLITDDRIKFVKSPFAVKDEIKAMRGPKWHGYDKEDPQPVWSVENHPRNVFQLRALMGEDVYAHFDQPLLPEPEGLRPETLVHQVDMIRRVLTYHFQLLAAEPGLGKSLVAIQCAEQTGGDWWYIGPVSAGESFILEMEKWQVKPGTFSEILTYQGLQKKIKYEKFKAPNGIVFDESTAVKTSSTNTTIAAQAIADYIRKSSNNAGYVVTMTGTPTAKSPQDIWSQAEVTFPGFLREGSEHAFRARYRNLELAKGLDGVTFMKELDWKEAEVEQIPNRLKGLMTVYRKADWLKLPEKKYRRVRLEPSKKVLRVAAALVQVASTAATALVWLRMLSSGFQYQMVANGEKACPACNMMPAGHDCPVCNGTRMIETKEREARVVKTPKVDALRAELEGQHRIIIAGSFTASIDRCIEVAREHGFATCRVDGRGWTSYDVEGKLIKGLHPLRHWKECKDPVAFVGNPGSCKFGLTLIEAKKMVFFDNDFSAENRLQMIDRFHRIGQTESPEIVDLIHLPVDERVLDILSSNRSLELITLAALNELIGEQPEDNLLE